jgi:hypothetical protein
MSWIDCRHWKISTGRHFQNGCHNTAKIQHCPISSKFDMWVYHYVKLYVSIIIHLEVININVRNFNFPIGFYSNPHPLWTPQQLGWCNNNNKNNNKKRSKNNKSPKLCLGDLITLTNRKNINPIISFFFTLFNVYSKCWMSLYRTF